MTRTSRMCGLCLGVMAGLLAARLVHPASLAAAEGPPPLDFQLVTEQSFPIASVQPWVDLLARLGQTSIRVRGAQSGDREEVVNRGTAAQPRYHVTGVLTGRNRLRLPGGEFGLSDRTRLDAWIKKVQADGPSGPTRKKSAFDLTEEQLVAFHEKMATPVGGVSRGRRAGDVARDIVRGVGIEFVVSDAAREAFQSSEVIADDLQPLSSGTALAAALRPLGLVMRPERAAMGPVRLRICEVRETEESWPIGWPPQDIPGKVAPKLFEFLKVTITNRPLTDALEAIQPRVGIPFLLDHNSLARRRIEPAMVKVTYAKERAAYQKILDHLLFQAGLTSELRVDEANRPFLWISPR